MIHNIYTKLCARIYNVGQQAARARLRENLLLSVEAGDKNCFHEGASVINLSGNRSNITIGVNCHLYGQLTIYPFAGSIQIGNHCSLGEFSRIVSGKRISIGNRVMIAHNVNIIDNNSHPKDAELRHEDFVNNYSGGMKEYDLQSKEIIIEDDVWIGFNSTILKGVKIGRGAIIGAGSMVTKDIEPWTINVGNPLRCIEKLTPPQNF